MAVTTAISAVQQAQERWRGNNPQFSDDLAEIGIASATTGDAPDLGTTSGQAER